MELTQGGVFLSLLKEQGGVTRWGKAGDSPFLFPGAQCIFCGKSAFKSNTGFAFRALVLVIDCITNHAETWYLNYCLRFCGSNGLSCVVILLHVTSAGVAVIWGLDWAAKSPMARSHVWCLGMEGRKTGFRGTARTFWLSTMWPQVLLLSMWPSHVVSPCGSCRV